MCPDPIGSTRSGAEPGSAPIIIRDADERDLPAIAAIFNLEVMESAYVYVETPLTLDDRRSWLAMHRSASLPVVVATDPGNTTEVLGWAALSPYRPATGYRFTLEASVYVARPAHRRGIGHRLLPRGRVGCTRSSRASTARTRRVSSCSIASATSRRLG
jgi:GNAT superfamily N-acetyltransferase